MIKRLTSYSLFVFTTFALLLFPQCKEKGKGPHRPKLVIGIVVDQMRYDYLFKYYNKWTEGGFKRLMKQGFLFQDAEYNYVPTFTAPGHTAIYTGTTPSVNGMVANDWFDRASNQMVYCTEDPTVQTVGSPSDKGMMSPRREITETIGDVLKLSDNGQSKVIGVSMKDRAAILPAGHSANAAYWYDDATGYFITSTYYMKNLPDWVKKFNDSQRANFYLKQTWNTLLPIEQYTESTADNTPYERPYKSEKTPTFPHVLADLMPQNGGYGLIKATPFGDDLTYEFARTAIENEKLGKGSATDMLTVSFSCTDYVGHQFGTNAIETEDTYLRLDRNISELLSFLDSYLGKDNVLVFLTADHGAAENAKYLMAQNIPAGYVDENALATSAIAYMKDKYDFNPILQFANLHFYLDAKAIEAKRLNIDTIEEEIAAVSLKYKGVERAIPAYRLSTFKKDFITDKIQNGYYPGRSGDVILNLLPDYLPYDTTGTTHGAPYIYDCHVPLLFYGDGIHHGVSAKEEKITNIAPTVASLLDIAFPDGCSGHPMLEEMKH